MRGGVVRYGFGLVAVIVMVAALAGVSVATEREFDDAATYPFKVSCGWKPFDVGVLEQPGGVEKGDSQLARLLRRISKGYAPEFGGRPTGWKVVGRSRKKMELVASEPPGLPNITVVKGGRFSQGPGWSMLNLSSGCDPMAVSDLGRAAIWHIDRDDLPLAADATRFTALVEELSCTGGQSPGDRLKEPAIHYGTGTIGIAFFVEPPRGVQTCPGNPVTEVAVRLDEPLGVRGLADLAVYPPEPIPTVLPIDYDEATRIAEEALLERFPSFRDPDRLYFGCDEGAAPTEARCPSFWGNERFGFRGHVLVARDDSAGGIHRWRYEIVRTDHRCMDQGGPASECKVTLTGEGTTAPG